MNILITLFAPFIGLFCLLIFLGAMREKNFLAYVVLFLISCVILFALLTKQINLALLLSAIAACVFGVMVTK